MEQIPKGKNLAEQFNVGHNEYASFIETDPIRNHLHYPSVIAELGVLQDKKVLDIGCGDGLFDRKLAHEYGAKMTGYDISPNLVAKAQRKEQDERLGIQYEIADPLRFQSAELFDDAIAVMVLPYAPNADYIKNFFGSAYKNLKAGGKFVAVVFNPAFRDFGHVVANRFFRKADSQKVCFDFLEPQSEEVKFSAELTQFSSDEYERGAREGGFNTVMWKNLLPDEEGKKGFGEEFWKKAIESQPYALIVAEK